MKEVTTKSAMGEIPLAPPVGAVVEAAAFATKSDVEAAMVASLAKVSAEILAAQRKSRLNSIWEINQAALALLSVLTADAACLVILWGARTSPEASPLRIAALVGLTNSASLVIGFYFGRTNHARPTPTNPQGDA